MLKIYVLYKNPLDFPGKYVVRLWYNDISEKEPLCVADNLEEARAVIPVGLYELLHQPGEPDCILASFF